MIGFDWMVLYLKVFAVDGRIVILDSAIVCLIGFDKTGGNRL